MPNNDRTVMNWAVQPKILRPSEANIWIRHVRNEWTHAVAILTAPNMKAIGGTGNGRWYVRRTVSEQCHSTYSSCLRQIVSSTGWRELGAISSLTDVWEMCCYTHFHREHKVCKRLRHQYCLKRRRFTSSRTSCGCEGLTLVPNKSHIFF